MAVRNDDHVDHMLSIFVYIDMMMYRFSWNNTVLTSAWLTGCLVVFYVIKLYYIMHQSFVNTTPPPPRR